MSKVKFSDVVNNIKVNIDREHNPYNHYIAGDHMDTEDIHLRRKGSFETDDVGPAFTRLFKIGQILYGSRRTYLKKAAIADFEGITANTTFVFESRDESIFLTKLLPFLIQSNSFTEWSVKKSKGSTNPYVVFSDLANFEFELPELKIQKEYEDILWKIDNTREAYRNLISSLDKLNKSRFIELFGNPTINEKGFPLLTVDDVIKFEGGSQPNKAFFEYEKTENNIRLIQIRDYKTDEYITYIPKDMAKRLCSADDIMIGRYGPPIFQILQGIEGAYNVALMKAIPKKGNKDFIRSWLKQDCLLKYLEALSGRTAGQDGIQMDKLKAYPFPYPPIELQDQWVKIDKQIDKSKFNLKRAIHELDLLTEKITSRLFCLND